ncbi:hypothetical protein QKW35_05830 [Pontibacterium granulatum]|uniref:hypothetical protein n=1 Tax=Pontibacterium granulatum TaxID=2036029 RepID=UPI00249CD02C|nr:hypothetical protein [Pontibacterium granulatum]MDI3323888.1 hypothetical protein [Pontibacterium granulatum]
MKRSCNFAVLALLLCPLNLLAAELTGRVSLLGLISDTPDDLQVNRDSLSANQQSLRLMLQDVTPNNEWSIHLRSNRLQTKGFALENNSPSDLFRYRELAGDAFAHDGDHHQARVRFEIDRLHYQHRFANGSLSIGRQPVDWGSGRFWQPLNVFGAFAPADLDTDFKAGIDSLIYDWYPTTFSSLSAVYAVAPRGEIRFGNSAALYYRLPAGERSELALLAGEVVDNRVVGASFESEWSGIGWRVEAIHYDQPDRRTDGLFWIAGLDYQFDNGTLLNLEWHQNALGSPDETGLEAIADSFLVQSGLQQQLGRQALGLGLSDDLTPLLRGSYTLLLSPLRDADNQRHLSSLHQFTLLYSLSDESDLLLSALLTAGRGLDSSGHPHSEFGHIPNSLTLRWRLYF